MKLKPEHIYRAAQNGIDYKTVNTRVKQHDWDIDRAINEPIKAKPRSQSVEVKSDIEHVIDELNALGYYDTAGKSLKELSTRLALHQIKAESSHNTWF